MGSKKQEEVVVMWLLLIGLWDEASDWTEAAFRALVDRTRSYVLAALGVLILFLAVSYMTETKSWLPLVAFIFCFVAGYVIWCEQTVHAAALTALFGIIWDREISEKQLRFLKKVAKGFYWILLGEFFLLLWFSLVPIWAAPLLLLVFEIALWIYFGMLSVPEWGSQQPFDKIKPWVFFGAVICTGVHLWLAFGVTAISTATSSAPVGISWFMTHILHIFVFCAIALVAIVLYWLTGIRGGDSHGEH